METVIGPWLQEMVRWGPGGLLVSVLLISVAMLWREIQRCVTRNETHMQLIVQALVDNTRAFEALTAEIRRGPR